MRFLYGTLVSTHMAREARTGEHCQRACIDRENKGIRVDRQPWASPSGAGENEDPISSRNPGSRGGSEILPERPEALTKTTMEERIAEQRYRVRLAGAEKAMETRLEANACPKENIASFSKKGFLGAGSFGEVFLVEYREDRKNYALKVQLKSECSEACEREGVILEKKLLHAMRNDFIVKIFFAFQDGVNLYLVMEHAKYGDFSRFKGRNLQEPLVKIYAAQLILAIEYIHACHIIHRDVKPANVLLFEDAYLKLGDFGVSKKVNCRTSSFVGPPAYMAPEIIRREEYGRQVDWWGVGLFIFELMFGQHPFCHPLWERAQITHAIMNSEVKFPVRGNSNPSLCSLLLGLLEKDQSKRLGALKGGVDDLRRHDWFKGISFVDVFNKDLSIQIDLDPIQPKRDQNNELLPELALCDDSQNLFDEF